MPSNVLHPRPSYLVPGTFQPFEVSGTGYIFEHEVNEDQLPVWFTLSTAVKLSPARLSAERLHWKQDGFTRPTTFSPFLTVSHCLDARVDFTYDLTEGEEPERAATSLNFKVPLHFVHNPIPSSMQSPVPTVRTSSPLQSDDTSLATSSPVSSSSVLDLPSASLPYAQPLPAYSQLFEPNGDRKIDYSVPLPLYTPHPSNSDLKLPSLPTDASHPDHEN